MILERLDTFIAFAVVMLMLSVMVMAFVQLAVSLLNLRGRNLRWGVRRLLQEAAPETFNEDGGLDPDQIAHEMLTHPALGPARNWVTRLLRWILERRGLLAKIGEWTAGDGKGRQAMQWLCKKLRLFRNNGWRPTTSLRQEQVVQILERIRREAAAGSPEKTRLTAALGDQTVKTEQFMAEGKKLAEQLQQQFPEQAKLLQQQIENVGKRGEVLAAKVEDWFETAMDATSERFKLRTRWLTAAGAVVLTFGFQVDSVSIFKQLSGESKLRDALVAQATQSPELWEALQVSASASVPPAPDTPDGASLDPEKAAHQRVEAAKAGLEKSRELVEATGLDILDPLYTTWDGFWADFGPFLPFGESPPDRVWEKLGKGLSGKVMTVLLLSLGAPFWYGALSKLTGLRSVVATKLDKKKEATS